MRRFNPLTIIGKRRIASDAIALTLRVPDELAEQYHYKHGQHLPVRARIDGKSVRRTYSICSSVADDELTLGIRVQPGGLFSEFAAEHLQVGDSLDVMPPTGRFHTPLVADCQRHYAAFAAGSGITPLYSIIKITLETEPQSTFTLFFGNRGRAETMLMDELWALKNIYPERVSLHFVMSREDNDIDLYAGRIDAARTRVLWDAFLASAPPDEVFICGPDEFATAIPDALAELGVDPAHIHTERFRAVRSGPAPEKPGESSATDGDVRVDVVMDGRTTSFAMARDGTSVLDAAAASGLDLPFSCKGGVCSTCRTRLTAGKVAMATNYALEPWELEKGFVLACQSTPVSDRLTLDYDKT